MCLFYENLYESKSIQDVDIDNYLSNDETPVLTENDKSLCDTFPSLEECEDAVINMKKNITWARWHT